MKDRGGRIALLIDGPNLRGTARALGFDIDYKRLLQEFAGRGTVLRAFYFTPVMEDQDYSSARPLVDWLDYNGFTVVTRTAKEFLDGEGRRKLKAGMEVDIAVHAMEICEHADEIVLFSGDGNFRSLVQALQRRGARVRVVSSIVMQPAMAADELRRQADVFIDVADLRPRICRDPSLRERRTAAGSDLRRGGRLNGSGNGADAAALEDEVVATNIRPR